MGQIKCASSERLVRLGISMAQLHILYTLQRSGEMPMSRLADVLNVSVSNATGLIDRIEERGFVERTRVPEDRRVVLDPRHRRRPPDARRGRRDRHGPAASTSSAASVGPSSPASAAPSPSCVAALEDGDRRRRRIAIRPPRPLHDHRRPSARAAGARSPSPPPTAPSGRHQRRTDLWPTNPTPSRPWRRTPPSA